MHTRDARFQVTDNGAAGSPYKFSEGGNAFVLPGRRVSPVLFALHWTVLGLTVWFVCSAATLHSRGSTLEKEKDIAIAAIERQQSTRDKIKTHVRRLSRTAAAAAPKPLAEQEE